jgi:hypothetical protein
MIVGSQGLQGETSGNENSTKKTVNCAEEFERAP